MTRLENFVLKVAKGIANAKGSTLAFRINNNDVDTNFIKAENTDSRVVHDFYNDAVIFLGNYANSVKIDIPKNEDSEYNLITKKKYKTVMKQNAISEAFNTEGTGMGFTDKLIIANIVVTFILMIIVVGVTA